MSGAYSDDNFFEDEPISSKREEITNICRVGQGIAEPKYLLFEVDERITNEQLEGPVQVSTHPPDDVAKSDMSTIEEESRSYETSTAASASHSDSRRSVRVHDHVASSRGDYVKHTKAEGLNVDDHDTLNELQQFVNETESRHRKEFDDQQRVHIPCSPTMTVNNDKNARENVQLKSKNSSLSEDGIDTLLSKLDTLESAQNILEQFFNTGVTDEIDVNAIIAQIPLVDQVVLNTENGYDISRSFNSEIASIQRIIDGDRGSSCSVTSEVDESNNNLLSTSDVIAVAASSHNERAVDDVLREYEEFELSLGRASIDESFRSDESLPKLSTYSSKPEDAINSAPIIKPPVLKSTISPSMSILGVSTTHFTTTATSSNNQTKLVPMPTRAIHCSPDSSFSNMITCMKPVKSVDNSSLNKKSGESKLSSGVERTRVEVHQTASGVKVAPSVEPSSTNFARPTTSATTTTYGTRDFNQEAFKPRNKKSMRSPRTMISPRHTTTEAFIDLPKKPSRIGASGDADGYQTVNVVSNFQDKSEYAVAEALKTIEKLNTMVARQETLLEAYSTDNQKLWTQLKEAKTESQEKEDKFQGVIDSLQTEVAKLKLNHLVAPSIANSPRQTELLKLRDDSELKNQQLKDLRKEILLLQSKLTEVRSPMKSKQLVAAVLSQDKEREYQKHIQVLNKRVRTLQNILYSKDQTSPPPQQHNSNSQTVFNKSRPLQRTKSDVTNHNLSLHQQNMIKSVRCTGADARGIFNRRPGTSTEININTGGILQASLSCLEQEREEFESIIAGKNRLIFEKEQMILQLKEKVETLRGQVPEGEVVDHGFIDDMRSRVITQNQVIQTLKEHLSSYKMMQAENVLLREEKSIQQQQILDLRRKLELTQNLGKPENEVLTILSEKVEELNSRYYHREKQLDTLLNRLTLKTTTGGNSITTYLSPLRLSSGQFSNNNDSLGGALSRGRTSGMYSSDLLNMDDFSPTASFQLFNAVSNKPDM